MPTSATLSRYSFAFLILNALLVVAVAALRPVWARHPAQENAPPVPDAQVISVQVPLLPTEQSSAEQSTKTEQTSTEQSTTGQPAAPASLPDVPSISLQTPETSDTAPRASEPVNRMVMEEMLKVIQESRGELDVPPLQFPALTPKPGASSATKLDQLALRMKSVAAVTQSAQTLIREAQQLEASGQKKSAEQLIEHVQVLRGIVLQLSGDAEQ